MPVSREIEGRNAIFVAEKDGKIVVCVGAQWLTEG